MQSPLKIQLKNSAILILLLTLVFHAKGQLLWKVNKPGSASQIYIFGTMHLPLGNYVLDHPTVSSAIENSEIVYTETSLNRDSIAAVLYKYIFLPPEIKLSDSLSSSEWHTLDSFVSLMGLPNLNAESLNRFKPIYVELMFTMLIYKKKTDSLPNNMSVDASVVEFSESRGKTMRYLETQEEQLHFLFNEQPLGSQFAMLRTALNKKANADSAQFNINSIPNAYRNQNLDSMELLIHSAGNRGAAESALYFSLFNKRNLNWTALIDDLATHEGKTYFIAMGAGHLPGDSGVLALLRQRNFITQPVPYR